MYVYMMCIYIYMYSIYKCNITLDYTDYVGLYYIMYIIMYIIYIYIYIQYTNLAYVYVALLHIHIRLNNHVWPIETVLARRCLYEFLRVLVSRWAHLTGRSLEHI